MASGDQDHAERTEGRQMLRAAGPLLCDFFLIFFFKFFFPSQVRSSCGERRQTSSLATQQSYFHTDLDLKNNKTIAPKHSRSLLYSRVPCPCSPAQLLPQIKSSLSPHQPREQLFCVSPTCPSNSPFPEDKQLPLNLCHQLPG